MRRLHHALTGLGILLGLIALGAPWWRVGLTTGAELTVTGFDASSVATTLAASAIAAYAAGALLRGVARRSVGLVQAITLVFAIVAWLSERNQPVEPLVAEITALTGVAGRGALDSVVALSGTGFLWLGLLAAALGAIGGLVGVFAPDAPARVSRYDRVTGPTDLSDSVGTWDLLTDGEDPTKR
jgi:hypothetical protein